MVLGIIKRWERENIRSVKELGLTAVEFCVNYDAEAADILAKKEEVKASCEEFGVKVGSLGRWGMPRFDAQGGIIPAALQQDKELIDLARFFDCPVYNVGCNYIEGKDFSENCKNAVKYFSLLLDYAQDKNVKIAVYNCEWDNFVCEPKAWREVLGALPALGVKYDTSHCINRGGDYLKEIADWGERIYHFHIKGNLRVNGETYDDSPAGLDTTKWGAVMALLYIKNYNGMLSIEPHSGNWHGARGEWGVRFTVNFMRPFIMPEDFPA